MHIFNQAGHYSYREHPEDFARVVADFIRAGGS
jgi:pimeloyl-ACP methyl ester carboxylesterase